MAFLPFLASVLSGWLLVHLVKPVKGRGPGWAVMLLEAALGAGAGAGLSSLLYFLLLIAGVASSGVLLLLDTLVLVALAALAWRARNRAPRAAGPAEPAAPRFKWTWVLVILFTACLLPILVTEVQISEANPHGGWDAWAIWNLRARYLAGPGESWRNAMSPLLTRTHPDYPLLLSGFVAHNWKVAGQTPPDTAVPIAAAFLFGGSVVALLVAGLALLRRTSLGLLAALVLLANRPFLQHLSWQYSDVPLSLYYLGTLVLLFISHADAHPRPVLMLAGLFASLAAWTKDEGIAFAAVILVCLAALEWWQGRWGRLLRSLPWFVAGALPGLLVVASLKLWLAPHVSPMVTQGASRAAGRVWMAERWWFLLQALFQRLVDLGTGLWSNPILLLAILAVALGVSIPAGYRKPWVFGVAAVGMVLACYCAVILSNPTLLGNRRQTPLDRMYTQLWPSFLFFACMPLRPLEQMASAVEAPVKAKRIKKRSG
jgi:hypothetical protein